MPFSDGTFDAVTSNYVYHNIPSKDRQAILLETLRIPKKGGTFTPHDLFTKQKYGDIQAFMRKLKSMDCEKVELTDRTKGKFMSEMEAKVLFLSALALLVGENRLKTHIFGKHTTSRGAHKRKLFSCVPLWCRKKLAFCKETCYNSSRIQVE